ncbi:uncharacterized protein LOC110728456 [Chenopodium quinoa]|uniref:uncharacterized protein LOC110728456 n=1 Tax=Chenopodium quinoa TaxID=63459 RepID=UPI000B7711EE|nr:uncharacterized protein LOC110728456 [Chenopodium quinoa]
MAKKRRRARAANCVSSSIVFASSCMHTVLCAFPSIRFGYFSEDDENIPRSGALCKSSHRQFGIFPVVNLFLAGKCPAELGEFIASAPLTPLVKLGGGIRPIAVGTVWQRLVSKVGAALIGPRLGNYLGGLQFGVGVPAGGEAILHVVNRLVEARGGDVGLSMLLVDFKNAFNLVDRTALLREVRLRCPALSRWVEFCYSSPARLFYGEHTLRSCQGVQQGDPLGPLLFALVLHPLVCRIRESFDLCLQAWYFDDGTIIGDTLVVGKVMELILVEGPRLGLDVNVEKTEVFSPTEDPRSRLAGVFPPDIARPVHGVKLLGGPVSADASVCGELVSQRVSKTIVLMDAIAKLEDPQCELLRLRACTGVSKLYFSMRTCPPRLFEVAQISFDVALRGSLERIVTASGPGDVRHYAFLASRLQSSGLQASLLRNSGIVRLASGFLMEVLAGGPHFCLVASGPDIRFGSDYKWDHAVSCAGMVGIKRQHNVVRDTLVDICFRSGISARKEVNVGLSGGNDGALRPADVLLYSWIEV